MFTNDPEVLAAIKWREQKERELAEAYERERLAKERAERDDLDTMALQAVDH